MKKLRVWHFILLIIIILLITVLLFLNNRISIISAKDIFNNESVQHSGREDNKNQI